jgi:hypothetical protein
MAGSMAGGKCEDLNSNPNTAKRKKREKKKQMSLSLMAMGLTMIGVFRGPTEGASHILRILDLFYPSLVSSKRNFQHLPDQINCDEVDMWESFGTLSICQGFWFWPSKC